MPGRMVIHNDGTRSYYIDGKKVSERKWRHWRPFEAPDYENGELPSVHVIDRDGRWALENGGRGHHMASLSEVGNEVYVQSRAELDEICSKRGLKAQDTWDDPCTGHAGAKKRAAEKFAEADRILDEDPGVEVST